MTDLLNYSAIEVATARYAAQNDDPVGVFEKAVRAGDLDSINQMDELPRYVNRFIQMGRSDLAAALVQEFATAGRPTASVLERIIEQNELMGASFFARGNAAARAIGRVIIRDNAGRTRGYGTGFMISPRLLMTNNHVLNSPTSASTSLIEFDYALGVDALPMVSKRFRFDPATFFETSGPLDFTIVAVEPINDESHSVQGRGWIHLIADSGKAVVGEPINIIQHPGGERQQIAIRENRIVRVVGDFLLYSTDTLGGSSGSAAMNDQWQLAALHHAGVPKKDSVGNWLRKDGAIFRRGIDDPAAIHWIANEGVRISSIVREMRTRPLNANGRSFFEAAFDPAPVTEILTNSGTGGQPPDQPDAKSAPGMSVGPDGVARWNFQLSFGPLEPSAKQSSTAPTHISPSPNQTTDTQFDLRRSAGDDATAESVFDRRGPYYDAGADNSASTAYYSGITERLSKKDRYTALHTLLKATHNTVLSYSSARHDHLYPWIDRRNDETLRSIYSDELMAEELFVVERLAFETAINRAAVARELAVASLTGELIEAEDDALEATSAFNCEHVVPQSWFHGEPEQRTQKSDLHHLFTCEGGCNSFRSNIPYSEFSASEEADLFSREVSPVEAILNPELEAARPQCGLRDGRRFEPGAGKGAVARATLYFVLRYPGVVGDIKSGNKKEFTKSNVKILMDWAEIEPPTEYEQHRNAEIAKIQGNRNPLIDHPEWLKKIAFEDGFG